MLVLANVITHSKMSNKCPISNCGGITYESGVAGEYCSKCGLIVETYYHQPKKLKSKVVHKRKQSCYGCGGTQNLTIHHIIPKRIGLKTTIILLCRHPCHDIADKIATTIYPKEVTLKQIIIQK